MMIAVATAAAVLRLELLLFSLIDRRG